MSDNSAIEWTDATWNPVTGCTKVSPGCDHCYAETFAERWRGTPGHHFENGFDLTLRPERLDQPLRWRKPRRIFVNSMSDLFHDGVSDGFIARVFSVMAAAPQHTFQVLTKRHGRMRSLLSSDDFLTRLSVWPLPNVWLGVSVENQQWANVRIPALLDTPAAVRWISAEPLLGPVELQPEWMWKTRGLHWVVVGGESGPGARPMHPDWARSLRDQCSAAGVAYHFKQWGQWTWHPQLDAPRGFLGPNGEWDRRQPRTARPDRWYPMWRVGKGAAGRSLDGRTWDEYPSVVGVGGV